jgi:predicted transcriptional regulator
MASPRWRDIEGDIPPPLHELEKEVMEEIWRHHEISVREVMEALNSCVLRHRAYTTYLMITARLDSKGLLERRREGKTDFYRPVHTRDRYTELCALAAMESVVDQSGKAALADMARQAAQLDPHHRRSLQCRARKVAAATGCVRAGACAGHRRSAPGYYDCHDGDSVGAPRVHGLTRGLAITLTRGSLSRGSTGSI